MFDVRRKSDWPMVALAVVAIAILGTLSGYVVAYFAMADEVWRDKMGGDNFEPPLVRSFRRDWQASAFAPAGRVESILRGSPVIVQSCDPPPDRP